MFSKGIDTADFGEALVFFSSFAVTLLFSWAIKRKGKPIQAHLPVQVGAVVCLAICTIAQSTFAGQDGVIIESFRVTCAALAGIGCAWLWMEWGRFYSTLPMEAVELVIPLSALWIPVCVLSLYAFSGAAVIVFIAALPVLSLACLARSLSDNPFYDPPHVERTYSAHAFWPNFARICIGAFAVHLVNSICLGLASDGFVEEVGGSLVALVIVGALIGVAGSFAVLSLSNIPDIHAAYRGFLPLLVAAPCALTFGDDAGRIVSVVCLFASQIGYSIILYIFLARIVHAGWRSYTFAFGIGRGFCQAGIALGAPCALVFMGAMEDGLLSLGSVCCMVSFLCITMIVWLMNRDSSFYAIGSIPDVPVAAGVFQKNWMKDESSSDQVGSMRNIDEVCRSIGETATLTERETEIFTLLAQGYSLPQIRDRLFISKNTVATHVKHLYRKLGIHSRQELLNMVYIGDDVQA